MVTDSPPVLGRIELLPGPQSDFVFSEARHPAMFSGRRGGKTVASCVKAFRFCAEHPGALGCLTAPTYRNVEDVVLSTWWSLFGKGAGILWDFKKNEMAILFKNGSKILLRPAEDPDKLRGLTLAFFGMDEAATGRQQTAFEVLQPTLSQQGFPHQGWVTTTPAGLRHWLYQRWVKKQLPNGDSLPVQEYERYQAHTKDNRYLTAEYLESLRASYGDTKWAQQELEGEFVAFEGQGFPQFDEKVHVRPFPGMQNVKRTVRGLDWGAVRPTSSHQAHLMKDGRIWVTDEFYERRCDERKLIEGVSDGFKVFCDPSAKDVIEMLRRYGIAARKAKSNDFGLRVRLTSARLAIGPDDLPGMYIDPSCPNLVEEYASLAYAKQRGQDILNDRWEPGLDDHAFDDVAYALMELDAGARGRPQPSMILRQWGHY